MISAPVEERRPLASPLEAAGRSRAGALAQRLPTDLAELRRRRRPVPETRRSYGADVGGEAPFYLGTAARAELRALEQLRSEGLAVLEAPEAQELRQLLRLPRAVREAPAPNHMGFGMFLGCRALFSAFSRCPAAKSVLRWAVRRLRSPQRDGATSCCVAQRRPSSSTGLSHGSSREIEKKSMNRSG